MHPAATNTILKTILGSLPVSIKPALITKIEIMRGALYAAGFQTVSELSFKPSGTGSFPIKLDECNHASEFRCVCACSSNSVEFRVASTVGARSYRMKALCSVVKWKVGNVILGLFSVVWILGSILG